MRKQILAWVNLFFIFCALSLGAQEKKNPFLVEWDDSIQQVRPGEEFRLKIHFEVPTDHFLYEEKTEIRFKELAGLKLVEQKFPPSKKKFDPFLKKEVQVYPESFDALLSFQVPSNIPLGRKTLEGEIFYQGCSGDLCYRPMKANLLVPLQIDLQKQQVRQENSTSTIEIKKNDSSRLNNLEEGSGFIHFFTLIKQGKIDFYLKQNFFILLLLVFLAGLVTDFISGCILPIIPLSLAVIGIRKERSVLQNFGISLFLALGMATTYTILGTLAVALGKSVGFLFQSQVFLAFLVLFFIFTSLGLWGVFRFELPLKVRNFLGGVGGAGRKGSYLAGLAIGLIALPCVGPVMGPLLLWVASEQKFAWGALILAFYGLGMGSLFVLSGTFYASVGGRFKAGRYAFIFKKGLAILMLLPALYYGSVLFGQWSKKTTQTVRDGWIPSFAEGLKKAKQEGKPIIIDFYADWCPPCLELDRKTFSNEKVKEAIKDFVALKIDCTLETSNCSEATQRFGVIGWPTVLFLNREQVLQNDLSIVGGFVGPDQMLKLLNEVQRR